MIVASFVLCACGLLGQTDAFVTGGGRLIARGGVSSRNTAVIERLSSCSADGGSRRGSRRGRGGRGGRGGGAGSLGMMFDTLAENMAGVASLFTGQKTITESRCGQAAAVWMVQLSHVMSASPSAKPQQSGKLK